MNGCGGVEPTPPQFFYKMFDVNRTLSMGKKKRKEYNYHTVNCLSPSEDGTVKKKGTGNR